MTSKQSSRAISGMVGLPKVLNAIGEHVTAMTSGLRGDGGGAGQPGAPAAVVGSGVVAGAGPVRR